jgi:hypothetical protein
MPSWNIDPSFPNVLIVNDDGFYDNGKIGIKGLLGYLDRAR